MNGFFIDVGTFLPDFLQEFSNGLPNIQSNFGQYLLQLVFSETPEPTSTQSNTNRENVVKTSTCKERSTYVRPQIAINELVPFFVKECAQRFKVVDKNFATYLIHLLVRDINEGLDLAETKGRLLSVCKLEQFLERCLHKYANPLDPTISSMKMCYYFKSCHELSLEYIHRKYEANSKQKLSHLIGSILQYPETSSQSQLEEMFVKMQVFIITNYEIGCPHNHVVSRKSNL